ncbi:MAG: GlmU family protein [Chitinophagales bacterium]|nr:GlmU family protein [Chitinophagales bacterium]
MQELNVVLFEEPHIRARLLPFTFTRHTGCIRIGILTIFEKWERLLSAKTSFIAEDYLAIKYPLSLHEDNLLINACILPDKPLAEAIANLQTGERLVKNGRPLAVRSNESYQSYLNGHYQEGHDLEYQEEVVFIDRIWQIFRHNGTAINLDFELLTAGRESQALHPSNTVLGDHPVFLEEGATAHCSVFNTKDGPIYIGKDAEVMEGCLVRGPFALCDHSQLKLGAKVYGPTTIGPHSKMGGEINNSVIFGYTNKAHDGFLGNSVLGEWCNLGADTNNSNLKNNYGNVKLWDYDSEEMVDTGLQFCGLFMGDHSKCGINTMFNTGTVVGVSANIFGGGFPKTMIPSFTWGGAGGFTTYHLNKAFEVAERVMSRRNLHLTDDDKRIMQKVFEATAQYRKNQLELEPTKGLNT